MHHAFKTWCIVSMNGRYARCAENIDAKKIPKSVRFRDFFIGFFSNRFQKKSRPDFQHGGGSERIHDGFEGSVCDISSQILTFFVFSRQNVYLERRHIKL